MEKVTIPPELEALPFEKALEELEILVSRMENGGLPLDELVKGFERGRLLAASCRNKLDHLERKITLLSRDDGADGEWQEFRDASEAPASPRAATTYDDNQPPF